MSQPLCLSSSLFLRIDIQKARRLVKNTKMVGWRMVMSVTLLATCLTIYQESVTIPSCEIVAPYNANANVNVNVNSDETVTKVEDDDPQDLTAILISNLLLLGSDSSFFDSYFTDFFLSKSLSKSLERLKPDILLVLGDVSAKGFQLTRKKWSSVLENFHRVLGPYVDLPFHVTLGDRDIGECDKSKASLVHRISSSFPGLDSAGCGSFEINNISFVSLNTVALLCSNNELLSNIETVIERESAYLQMKTEEGKEQRVRSSATNKASYELKWRENSASSRSGPVLLLHFPLHQKSKSYCRKESSFNTILNSFLGSLKLLKSRIHTDSAPYDLLHNVPPNATEYIFQALKPRMIFSAHSQEFCDFIHPDGTREVTIPALAWTAKNDPGFVVATFRRNGVITVRHCSLSRESHILVACVSIFTLFILNVVRTNLLHLNKCRTQ